MKTDCKLEMLNCEISPKTCSFREGTWDNGVWFICMKNDFSWMVILSLLASTGNNLRASDSILVYLLPRTSRHSLAVLSPNVYAVLSPHLTPMSVQFYVSSNDCKLTLSLIRPQFVYFIFWIFLFLVSHRALYLRQAGGRILAERLSARLLILQCVFSVGGVWCHASGMQFVTL